MKPFRQHSFLSSIRGLFTGASIAACTAAVSHAAALTWDGSNTANSIADGGAGTWDTNIVANWWDGLGNVTWPAAGGTDDDAIFEGAAGLVTIDAAGVTANDLVFNVDGYSLSGGSLTLNGGAPSITTTTGTATIHSVIAGTAGLTKSGNGTLVLNGTNTYTGTTTISGGTLQAGDGGATGIVGNGTSAISIGATGTLTLFRSGTGIAFNNAVSGSGTLEFKGSGIANNGAYTVGGVNTGFAGSIKVTDARLQIDNATDVGSASITVNSGGSVFASGGTFANALSLNGIGWSETAGNLGALRMSGGATWSGDVTLAGNARITTHSAGDTGTISGVIGGGSALQKTGAGTLTLSNANTYSGGTVLSAGTLILGNASALGTGTVTVTGNSTISSSVAFSKDIAILAGATLNLHSGFTAHTGVISGEGAVAVSANTQLFGANTYTGGTSLSGSAVFTCINSDSSFGAVPATFSASNITVASGGTNLSTFGAPANASITLDANRGVALSGNLSFDIKTGDTLTINGVISGSGELNRNNSTTNGTLVLNGLNTYTGITRVHRGTTTVNTIKNVGDVTGSSLGNPATVANGTIHISTGGTAGTLKYVGAGNVTDRVITLSGSTASSTLDQSGTDLLKFTSGVTNTGLGSKTLILTGSSSGSGEISGVIANNATTGQTGLSTAFAAGATQITLNSVDGIANGASISGAGIAAGTTVTAVNTSTRVVTLSAATSGAGTGGSAYTVAGVVNLTRLTKSGSGTWVLSGANTYNGVTTLSAGILSVGTIGNGGVAGNLGQATSAAANLVFDGGTLQYTGATASTNRAFTLNASKSGTFDIPQAGTNLTLSGASAATTGSMVKTGAGTLILTGANAHTGTTTVSGGTLQIGDGGTTGQLGGGTVIVNDATLSVNRGNGLTISSAISGNTGGIVSIDSAAGQTIQLNGSMSAFAGTVNANTAITSIGTSSSGSALAIWNVANGATLRSNSPGAVAGATRVVQLGALAGVAGSTLRNGGTAPTSGTHMTVFEVGALNANTTFAGAINDSAATVITGLTKVGNGTLTLSGTSTYTGATTVSAGSLIVNGTVSGSAVTVDGGTLGGSGTVKNIILASGTLAPGNSPGILNSGDVAFNGGTFALDLSGATPGTEHDQLNVTGGVAFNGLVSLNINLGAFDPVDDGSQKFTIVNNDLADAVGFNFGSNQAFAYNSTALDEGAHFFVGAQEFAISYASGDGNDVVLTAVPEPGAAISLLGGLAALTSCRRRRMRA